MLASTLPCLCTIHIGVRKIRKLHGSKRGGMVLRCKDGAKGAKVAKGREGVAKDGCSTHSHYPSRCMMCTKSLSGQHHLALSYCTPPPLTHSEITHSLTRLRKAETFRRKPVAQQAAGHYNADTPETARDSLSWLQSAVLRPSSSSRKSRILRESPKIMRMRRNVAGQCRYHRLAWV